MLIYKITLSINGEKFSPSDFLEVIELVDISILDKNESGELIWDDKDAVYDFGSISILNKNIFCLKNELDLFEKWYSDFFSKNRQKIINLGATQIVYGIDIFYSDFCSFELSCSENYHCYQDFNFSIPINVYKLSDEEIIAILLENHYDLEFITEYEW